MKARKTVEVWVKAAEQRDGYRVPRMWKIGIGVWNYTAYSTSEIRANVVATVEGVALDSRYA